jgi:hypothetical protein
VSKKKKKKRLLSAVPTPQSWLPGPAFLTALRYRLGLPVLSAVTRCGLGCHALADAEGVHTLSCMFGGPRMFGWE